MPAARRPVALLVFLALSACGKPLLSQADSRIRLEPTSLEFERTFVGYPTHQTLTIYNDGLVAADLQIAAAAPLTVDPAQARLEGGGSVAVSVTFDPTAAGAVASRIVIKWDEVQVAVPTTAMAELPPKCPAPAMCHASIFDPGKGACIDALKADGTSCNLEDKCLGEPRCWMGTCVGNTISCDDDNDCTRDACDPAVGCIHVDISAECPAPSDACHVAICQPHGGCGEAGVDDGTVCGPVDCRSADVCVLSRCMTLPVPEGFKCAPATPCQGEGACHDQVCQRPDPGPMTASWSYESPEGLEIRFPGTVDDHGQLYLLEVSKDRGVLTSLTGDGFTRYRVELTPTAWSWYMAAIALDLKSQVAYLSNGSSIVEAHRMSDGSSLWVMDLKAVLDDQATAGYAREFGINDLTPLPDQGQLLVSAIVGEETHESFLLALDTQSGAVKWTLQRAGHFYGYVADKGGNAYVSNYGCWAMAGELLSVGPDGQVRWSSDEGGNPYAISNGQMLVYRNGLVTVDAKAGADGFKVSSDASYYDEVLVGPSDIYLWDRAWAGAGISLTLRSVDPVTGAERWNTHEDHQSLAGTPMATTRGTLLSVTYPATGSYDERSHHNLREIGWGGSEVFACEIPGTVTGSPALAGGRWVATVSGVLTAFPAPGLEVAQTGWVTSAGNPARTHQPR
jgi:hypothetical protein